MIRATHPTHTTGRRSERGSTLAFMLAALTLIVGLSFAFSSHVLSTSRGARAIVDRARAEIVAEAAVHEAWSVIETRGLDVQKARTYPRTLDGVSYDLVLVDGDTDATLVPSHVRLTAVATVGDQTAGAELVVQQSAPSLGRGVFARTKVHLEDDSAIDAYDSEVGPYTDQATHVVDGFTFAGSDAVVGTNGDIETRSGARIFGDGRLGPTGWHVDDGTGVVTGTVTQSATERSLPPITIPWIASAGNLDVSGSGTALTIGPGELAFDDLRVASGAELTIVGPAAVVCSRTRVESGGRVLLDTSHGGIEFHCSGEFDVRDASEWTTVDGMPTGVNVYLSSTSDTHRIRNGAVFTGAILAPDSTVVIEDTVDVYGAVLADFVTLKTHARVHLDNALGTWTGGLPTWKLVSVNRVSGTDAEVAVTGAGAGAGAGAGTPPPPDPLLNPDAPDDE